MRRLVVAALLSFVLLGSCRDRDRIPVQPTEEDALRLVPELGMADPAAGVQLISGFYALEENAWRWTSSDFLVTLKTPPGAYRFGATLSFDFVLPDAVLAKTGPVTLTANSEGVPLGSRRFERVGSQVLTLPVAGNLLIPETVAFRFTLDKFLPAGTSDARELGVIARSFALRVNATQSAKPASRKELRP